MNATEWQWMVARIDGLGDVLAECAHQEGDPPGIRLRRRLGISIVEEGGVGKFSLHVNRTPHLDLMEKIAPIIGVDARRIVYLGNASGDAVKLAEQALGEGERIVKAKPGDVERVASVLRGGNGG